ncbi:MAG: exosortase A [Woeseiaceae bacterium]|nr:exosortase A [Woeseiaceae bacterium]
MTQVATSQGVPQRDGIAHSDWVLPVILLAVAVLTSVWVFRETWQSMLHIWLNIDTYNYGLFVPLISIFLIFRIRRSLLMLSPTASVWGLAATLGVSFLWAIGELAGVLAVKQLAVLALVPAMAFSILGPAVFRRAAFPLLYLLFALPVGEFTIPVLITWTADFSVAALEWLGVPVYRDGPYIRIPAGDFQVVKACSGIRYLLTSVVLGALFAYLSFRSPWRRAAFLALCVVAPIVANWIRATCIILIAHLSDMRLAAGVDHFIYGWLFFGIVMLLIFLIGSRFRDGHRASDDESSSGELQRARRSRPIQLLLVFAGLLPAFSLGIPVSGFIAERAASFAEPRPQLLLPTDHQGWVRQNEDLAEWRPRFSGASLVSRADYRASAGSRELVAALAVYYDTQKEGAELINVRNSIYDSDVWWLRQEQRRRFTDERSGASVRLIETVISDGLRNRVIWHWYSISGRNVTGVVETKLATLGAALAAADSGATLFGAAIDYGDDLDGGRAALNRFMSAYFDEVTHCLAPVARSGDRCE